MSRRGSAWSRTFGGLDHQIIQRLNGIIAFQGRRRKRQNSTTLQPYRLFRWDEIALEKVTEMVSRKFISGERETMAQIYLKRGAVVPQHAHDSEQMTYVLQGALKLLVGGEEVTLREGEVLHITPGVAHQVEALDDTFVLGVFSPVRRDWVE